MGTFKTSGGLRPQAVSTVKPMVLDKVGGRLWAVSGSVSTYINCQRVNVSTTVDDELERLLNSRKVLIKSSESELQILSRQNTRRDAGDILQHFIFREYVIDLKNIR